MCSAFWLLIVYFNFASVCCCVFTKLVCVLYKDKLIWAHFPSYTFAFETLQNV